MGLFLNPLNMILGGLLISSPIIIHLINRMRFKRVRWAAMEFLLKAQKRSRRKMIIEQLILLLLRILLILLIGLLLARYYSTLTGVGAGTLHVLVVDDSLSMSDRNREDAKAQDEPHGKRHHPGFVSCYERGRDRITELLGMASKTNAPQEVRVVLLSEADKEEPFFQEALSDQTAANLDTALENKRPEPTFRHLLVLRGLQRAKSLLLEDTSNRSKVLHIVSDFREEDWGPGEGDELNKELVDLARHGVNVSFIDAAADPRKNNRGEARWHENVAIVDLQSASRTALENAEVEFTVVLENNSLSMKYPNLLVRIDGGPPDDFGSKQLPGISPGQRVEEKFRVMLTRPDKDSPKPQFRRVSAEIVPEENGLTADHIRDVVVQVVKSVPILIAIPDDQDPQAITNEAYYLKTALTNDRLLVKYQVEVVPAAKLAGLDLDQYATIYLLNLHDFETPVVEKLRDYAARGGSLAFFLGDRIKDAGFYNEELHKNQKGLFPVLVKGTPEVKPKPEDIADRKQNDPDPKLLFPDKGHPAVQKVAGLNPWFFAPVSMNVYYQTLPPGQWLPDAAKETQVLIRMAPRKVTADYRPRVLEMLKEIEELTAADLKGADRRGQRDAKLKDRNLVGFGAQVERIDLRVEQLRAALTKKYPYLFDPILDALLHEQEPKGAAEGNAPRAPDKEPKEPAKGPTKPDMPQFWAATPETKKLADKLEAFRRELTTGGDPLLVGREYGKGKVVAWLSSATARYEWHDYGEGKNPSAATFIPFVFGLESYLQNNRSEAALTLGGKAEAFQRDPALYDGEVKVQFFPQADLSEDPKKVRQVNPRDSKARMDLSAVADGPDKGKPILKWTPELTAPGVYLFEFTPKRTDLPADIRGLAVNVDAGKESNLRRVSQERLQIQAGSGKEAGVGTFRLIEAGDGFDSFKKNDADLSESPWLYLFFLLILIGEQAMAVHLSYHLKGEGSAPATPARAA